MRERRNFQAKAVSKPKERFARSTGGTHRTLRPPAELAGLPHFFFCLLQSMFLP